MKRHWNGLTLALVTSLGFAAQATAEPLDLKQVAADAKWVGHVDFDAVRESTVAQKAMAKHMEKHKNAEAHLKMFEALVGMDPRKDLHGLTAYGMAIGKHKGVMILHAKLNKDRIQAWAEKLPGRETSEHGDYKISTWTKKHHGHEHTLASTWHGDSRLVVASSVDELKAALDVLDGKSAGVGEDGGLAGAIPAGTTVLGRATGISDADLKCKNPVAKQTKSARFAMGENEGESFFRVRANMTNEEIVGQAKEIIEGAQALGRICAGDNEGKLRMIEGLKIQPEGDTLTVLWSASADDVWKHMEEASRKWEGKLAQMRKHRGKHGHWGKAGGDCKKCSKGEKCDDKCQDKDKKSKDDKQDEEKASEKSSSGDV